MFLLNVELIHLDKFEDTKEVTRGRKSKISKG